MKKSEKAEASKIKIDYTGVGKAKISRAAVESVVEKTSIENVEKAKADSAGQEDSDDKNEAVLKRLDYIQQMIKTMQDSLD